MTGKAMHCTIPIKSLTDACEEVKLIGQIIEWLLKEGYNKKQLCIHLS